MIAAFRRAVALAMMSQGRGLPLEFWPGCFLEKPRLLLAGEGFRVEVEGYGAWFFYVIDDEWIKQSHELSRAEDFLLRSWNYRTGTVQVLDIQD